MNLAVEYREWNGMETVTRTGLLLQLGKGGNGGSVAWVLVRKQQHDPTYHSNTPNGTIIIREIDYTKLIVKGVHIPFEP